MAGTIPQTGGNDNIGQQGVPDFGSEYSKVNFIVGQIMARARTAFIAKVTSLTNGGGKHAPAGRVSVQPLTKMTDGGGKATSHGSVPELLYFRLQGNNKGAVICDPEVGTIGVAVVCDRDISGSKSSGSEANPGSGRRNDMADGIFFPMPWPEKPETYVIFHPDGQMSITPPKDDTSKKLYLGGDKPNHPELLFSPVMTAAGPSINVQARIS